MSVVSSQNSNLRDESDRFMEPRKQEFDSWGVDVQEVVLSRINSPDEMGLCLLQPKSTH